MFIGAGAVVTKNVAPGPVVAGVPARVVGSFDSFVRKRLDYGSEFIGLSTEQREELEWKLFQTRYEKRL